MGELLDRLVALDLADDTLERLGEMRRAAGDERVGALVVTAQPIDARQAFEYGLLNDVVEPGALLPTALETADTIAANGPLAVRATRQGVRELLGTPLVEAYPRQEELGRPLRRTEDAREAQRAFVEKRKPVFKGR